MMQFELHSNQLRLLGVVLDLVRDWDIDPAVISGCAVLDDQAEKGWVTVTLADQKATLKFELKRPETPAHLAALPNPHPWEFHGNHCTLRICFEREAPLDYELHTWYVVSVERDVQGFYYFPEVREDESADH